jgi:hypothetical protein
MVSELQEEHGIVTEGKWNRVAVLSMMKKRPDGVKSRDAMRYRQGNLVGKSHE